MKIYKIIEKKQIWFGISLAIIAVGIITLLLHGFNWGIDFTGGNILQYNIKESYRLQDAREILDTLNIKHEVKKAGESEQLLIVRTEILTKEQQAAITDALKQKWPNIELERTEGIDPIIGKELQKQAIIALIIANIGMMIYITFRFEFKSAIAAVLALIHDVLIIISFYSVFYIPIDSTFIAVILTIVGYSINDTIVIFDRIRENLKLNKNKKSSFTDLANLSISQSLTRTINTSITTILTVLALFLFGGTTIKEFTLALLVGLVSGTYSSIFIASPLWAMFRGKPKTARA